MRKGIVGVAAAAAVGLLGGPGMARGATVTAYPVPTGSAGLTDIAAAPDGSLWFTEHHAGKLGRIALDGSIAEVKVPNGTSLDDTDDIGPTHVVADAGGQAMDFLTDIGETVGSVTLGGTITHLYANGGSLNALSISAARGGGVWELFYLGDVTARRLTLAGQYEDYGTDSVSADVDPMVTTADGTMFYGDQGNAVRGFTEGGAALSYPVPDADTSDDITGLALDAGGALHFTQYFGASDALLVDQGGSLGAISPAGQVTVADLGGDRLPRSMVLGPDGALWWGEKNGIGRLDPASGTVQHASLGAYDPTRIAFGGDGALWFVDDDANSVGRVAVGADTFPAAAAPVPAPGPAPAPTGPVTARAPAIGLKAAAQRLATVRRRRAIRVTGSLAGAGRLTVRATLPASVGRRLGLRPSSGKATTVTLAGASHAFAGAGSATLTLRLGAKARSALRRSRHSLRVTLRATAQRPGATSVTRTLAITLAR